MPKWIRLTDRNLRQVLAWRREQAPIFDSFFFDSTMVFVYAARRPDPAEFLSNIVHEYGHALLADTPVGFLLQTLFEVQARIAQKLYRDSIQPVFRQHVTAEASPGDRAAQLGYLANIGPRAFSTTQAVRTEANELFEKSAGPLRAALNQDDVRPLVQSFQTVHRRSALLRKAAALPHEAMATFYQCGGGDALVMERYSWVAEQLPPEMGMPTALPGVLSYVAACRADFTEADPWGLGFSRSLDIFSTMGGSKAVLLATSAALHFPYAACGFLDCSDEEFTDWVRSPRLGPDVRFAAICAEPELVKAAVRDPTRVGALLARVVEGHDLRPLTDGAEQFFRWVREYIVRSKCCGPAQPLLADIASRVGLSGQESDWMARLINPRVRTMPPILLDDGTVYAMHESEARWLANDFERAEVVRIVARITDRLDSSA